MPLSAGAHLGPYEVLGPLGSGGMGEVFRALDTRLGREVAVKVLSRTLADDENVLARFEREGRAVAALSHPNVLSVHDVGEWQGLPYIVTELLEGETLRQRLVHGPLLPRKAAEVASEIALGLGAAHEKGIVHRDLKPSNVFLTNDGRVKILDFGLAGWGVSNPGILEPAPADARNVPTSDPLTDPGSVFGTVGYMAPEQVRGEAADARSDVFALGALLFEMCTGVRAFRRETAVETMGAILRDEPDQLRTQTLPSGLRRIVRHCLEKNPAERFQSARDLAFALTFVTRASTEAVALGSRRRESEASVAVLPFVSHGSDPENEIFSDGITEDVIVTLSRIRALKVIARSSVMRFKNREQTPREIGAALGAASVIDGSVRRIGNRVRIVARLVDGRTDRQLWGETYDRELHDIFAIQTDVALQIAEALRAELSPEEVSRLQRLGGRPTDPEAYQLYLKGRQLLARFTPDGLRQAIAFFERAIERDPGFALAYTGVAMAYTELAESGTLRPDDGYRRAKEAATTALAIDPELGEAHGVLGHVRVVFDFDWTGAEAAFRRGLELSPNSADIHDLYGRMCSALERWDESLALERKALELDPLVHRADVAATLLRAGRLEEARAEAERCLEIDPEYDRGHATLGWVRLAMGRVAEGVRELERAVALSGETSVWLAQLGQAYARAGRRADAENVLDRLHDLSGRRYVSPYHFAYVHAGLGDPETAMDWLDRAYEERAGAVYGVKGSFLFTSLHAHPRFLALLKRMNFPEPEIPARLASGA